MRHKARDRRSVRAKRATTATLQVALFFVVGVSQPCRKVLLGGSPPESREMGPELGPRLQGPIQEGPVCGPRIRAALLGKKSPDKWRKSRLTNGEKVPSRTTFGSPPKGVPSAVRKGHSTTRCASSWTLAARSVVDAKVTASQAAGSRRETKCRVVSKAQLYTTAGSRQETKCRVISKAQLYTTAGSRRETKCRVVSYLVSSLVSCSSCLVSCVSCLLSPVSSTTR